MDAYDAMEKHKNLRRTGRPAIGHLYKYNNNNETKLTQDVRIFVRLRNFPNTDNILIYRITPMMQLFGTTENTHYGKLMPQIDV